MIPLTSLSDDYIDRPKLSEQKNPVEYIVPSPLKWVGTTRKNAHKQEQTKITKPCHRKNGFTRSNTNTQALTC